MKKKTLLCVFSILAMALSLASASVTTLFRVQPTFGYSSYPLIGSDNFWTLEGKTDSNWYETYQDIYRRYYAEPGLFDIGVAVDDEHFGFVLDLDFRNDFKAYVTKSSWSNIPYVGNTLSAITDLNFPRLGFAEVKFDRFYASIGRRQIKWGPSEYDMAISDSAPYLDNLWLDYKTPSKNGNLWYNFIAVGLNTEAINGGNKPSEGKMKNLFAHRLGWENDFFRIGIGELNLVYGEMPDLMDFTPFGIWHNLYQDERSNVMLNLSLEGLIAKALRLYGTFTMDDFDLPSEPKENGKPAAMGFNAGLQWHILDGNSIESREFSYQDYVLKEDSFEFNDGLNVAYEFYFATPYLYNRSEDMGKFTVPMRLFTNGYVTESNAFFIGFPYGPNSMLHRVEIEYSEKNWKADLTGEYLIRGDYGIDSAYGNDDIPGYRDYCYALRGNLTHTVLVTAGAQWNWKPGFKVSASLTGAFDLTHGRNAIKAKLGASIDIPSLF